MIIKCLKSGRYATPNRPDVAQITMQEGDIKDVPELLGLRMIETGNGEEITEEDVAEEPEEESVQEEKPNKWSKKGK